MTPKPFAKLFDIDGTPVLFDVSPAKTPGRIQVAVSIPLETMRYIASVELAVRQDVGIADPVDYIIEQISEERAREELRQASDFGTPSQAPFAKLLEVDGRQVLAVLDTPDGDEELDVIQAEVQDADESTFLLRVKVAFEGGPPIRFAMLDDAQGSMLARFDQDMARGCVEYALAGAPDYVICPPPAAPKSPAGP